MTFALLQSDFITLKRRLTVHFGSAALADITIDPPQGHSDELSFIKLVAWGYVLLHESAKTQLGFLCQLPPASISSGGILPYVRALRTWTSHNLKLEKDRDVKTLRTAIEWFSKTCGVGTPTSADHWNKCFSALENDLHAVLSNAINACDSFETPSGPALIASFKDRLNRSWDAYRFDTYAQEASEKLNYTGLDVVSFRTANLEKWRKVVELSTDAHIIRNLNLRIESDLIELMANALPITISELEALLNFKDRNALASALIFLRAQNGHERKDVLSYLKAAAE